MRWIVAFLACIGIAQAQVIQHQISDDSWARVPLQFPFPYYGRVFTDSYMFSNGVIGFGSVQQGWCCSGYDLTRESGYHLNYAIMPLQTDLINYGQGRFLTEGTPQYQRYKWENISEYGRPQNLNTFGVEIRPSGFIGMYYDQVKIDSHVVTIGMTGNTTLGEYTQHYNGFGLSRTNFSYTTDATGNMCLVNPLSSSSCPGYQEAYTAQQCSLSPLYSPVCPGYEQAYFSNQCSLNPLYDRTCPGYAEAYFNQQCTANALYDRTCPGYAEAYALAHVVAAPTVTVSAPTVQVSTTGTVSVETPVVSDPVVNEVITRPATQTVTTNATSSISNTSPTSQVTQAAQTESKTEKKTETKQTVSAKKPETKNEVTSSAPVITEVYQAPPPVLIVDMLFKQMVKKPIQDNNRSYYALIMGSQKTHEEMVNEQYRKRD